VHRRVPARPHRRGRRTARRPPAPFHCNGTFEVYRKLHTDVAAFRSYMEEKGRDYPGGPDLLSAKIVGRWSDGTPLVLSPDGPDPDIVDDPGGSTTSPTPRTRRGCAARWARTSAGPIRATRRASSRAG
jgi:deferrochelatase/peroxidase EfeB